jgi:transitional endoplasmic reticulum ATPase
MADCAVLQIVPSSTPPVKSLRYTPMILLTSDDADRLGVLTGDSVLLLATEFSKDGSSLRGTAMARVHVATSASTPTAKSQASFRSPKTQRSKLSFGYCHVFPVSLAHQFYGTRMKQEDEGTVPQTPRESPSIPAKEATPTPSKFSFAKGGGGDRLISSPTALGTPQVRKGGQDNGTTKGRGSNEVWVVPLESTLGGRLTELLCHTATHVSLDVSLEDSSTISDRNTPSSESKVLQGSLGQQLIRAHLLSSHLSKGSQVAISVQGQSIPCQVTDVLSSETDSTARLQTQIKMLSLDDEMDLTLDDESRQLLAIVQKGLVSYRNDKSESKIQLYLIMDNTMISFGDDKSNTSTTPMIAALPAPKPLLAGLDDTIERVQSLLTIPLRHPELFQPDRISSLRPPKGVLLYGSSGSGKSSLTMQVAQSLRFSHKVHVQEISCAKLQSQTALVGQAEQELVRLFEMATKRGKSSKEFRATLILLDDVHLICPQRQGMNVGADRLASTLLALLDGLDSNDNSAKENNKARNEASPASTFHPIMVLAATSNPSLLDPALRRPGRLDAEVEVPLPDEPTTRRDILQFQMKSLGARVNINDESEEWIDLARLAKGFTGADLRLATKEAIRMSILRGHWDPSKEKSTEIIEVDKQDMKDAIRSIKPSAIKAVTVEIPRVHWSSIGGMEEVKRQLREAIELPLTHGAMFQQLGIRPPRGVLLYGPPGCSKTLMARALATEGHMNFLAVKGPELLSKWLGESERALASLFRRARLASPSVIFFDEVDAIATKRGGGNAGGGERLLSQLLTELDGIQSSSSSGSDQKKQRVVVVCATNRPDLLDGALMRPGRIDRMIYVGVPDQESRRRILELGMQGKACSDDLDVSVYHQKKLSCVS